jgi:MerR family transcriptional regulator, repressor of the yfmOP operon
MGETSEALRIGDVARRVGTTPRTIRYYEEIGLLEPAPTRLAGSHRTYTQHDVERLREILRLRDLLGVSLDELKDLVAAEDARAAIREEFRRAEDPEVRIALLNEALGHLDRQLELVRRRRHELDALEDELCERHQRVRNRLESEQSGNAPAPAGAR